MGRACLPKPPLTPAYELLVGPRLGWRHMRERDVWGQGRGAGGERKEGQNIVSVAQSERPVSVMVTLFFCQFEAPPAMRGSRGPRLHITVWRPQRGVGCWCYNGRLCFSGLGKDAWVFFMGEGPLCSHIAQATLIVFYVFCMASMQLPVLVVSQSSMMVSVSHVAFSIVPAGLCHR
jgi:hypothetical protein